MINPYLKAISLVKCVIINKMKRNQESQNKTDIIIFGAGGHANVVIDIIEKQGLYNIFGIFVDTPEMQGKSIMNYPILGNVNDFYGSGLGFIAVGDNFGRQVVASKIKSKDPDFKFVRLIHPAALIGKNVEIGEGTVVVGGAVINSNTRIGESCIINTNSSVDHDVVIDNFSSIAPGATVGGNCKIGKFTTVGLGSNIIQKVTIGEGSLIGAGSTVLKDVPEYVLVYGSPASIIRQREIDEKFM